MIKRPLVIICGCGLGKGSGWGRSIRRAVDEYSESPKISG